MLARACRFNSCPRHKMAVHKLDTLVFVGQKAFIRRRDKILVLRDPKYAVNGEVGLDFPGGKYRWGHDIFDELIREVVEETSLNIKIGRPFVTWTAEYKVRKKDHRKVYLVGYLCDWVSGEVKLSDEHDKFEWVDEKSYKNWRENTGYFRALAEYFNIIK